MAQITLEGSPATTNGELPLLNASLPDFKLVDKDLSDKSLKDFKGKRKLLSFVPSLDTPVCSLSTIKFNEALAAMRGIVALVISCDLPFAQTRMCSQEKVEHIMTLSIMRNKDCAEAYGLLIQDGPLAGLCARAIVVADENDRVVYTELVSEIGQEPDYEKALKALRS